MSSAAPQNLLLTEIQYKFEETPHGVWRRFVYPDGSRFAEYRSHRTWGTLPLVHYTYGSCPETGKRITARGVDRCRPVRARHHRHWPGIDGRRRDRPT